MRCIWNLSAAIAPQLIPSIGAAASAFEGAFILVAAKPITIAIVAIVPFIIILFISVFLVILLLLFSRFFSCTLTKLILFWYLYILRIKKCIIIDCYYSCSYSNSAIELTPTHTELVAGIWHLV